MPSKIWGVDPLWLSHFLAFPLTSSLVPPHVKRRVLCTCHKYSHIKDCVSLVFVCLLLRFLEKKILQEDSRNSQCTCHQWEKSLPADGHSATHCRSWKYEILSSYYLLWPTIFSVLFRRFCLFFFVFCRRRRFIIFLYIETVFIWDFLQGWFDGESSE